MSVWVPSVWIITQWVGEGWPDIVPNAQVFQVVQAVPGQPWRRGARHHA
jgi:hypothetical protein